MRFPWGQDSSAHSSVIWAWRNSCHYILILTLWLLDGNWQCWRGLSSFCLLGGFTILLSYIWHTVVLVYGAQHYDLIYVYTEKWFHNVSLVAITSHSYNFIFYSLVNFQIYSAVFLSIFTMLYITLAWNSTLKRLRSWHLVPSLHGK